MTPKRAQELLNAKSEVLGGMSALWAGSIDKHLRPGERDQVTSVWDTMPGNTSWADALQYIANGKLTSDQIVTQSTNTH